MKISFNWLRDYIDTSLNPHEAADRLTMCGIEVESVVEFRPRLDGIIVSKVLAVRPHPNADRLSLCRVTDGNKEQEVVCGAPDVRPGQFSPLANVGTVLPNGVKVARAKIRGIVSEGMLCSERELGLGEDEKGVMLLPPGSRPGAGLAGALDLADHILDVGVSPNRPDCLSMMGIARELAAIEGISVKPPPYSLEEKGGRTGSIVSIEVMEPGLCPRYSARMITGVKIGTSPFWMRNRLGMAGVRAVNNIVDITNYVLMEMGQPLHPFDFKKISGQKIVVRRAGRGEKLVTIDGLERDLEPDTLVIADREKPVALAGVMGGADSAVGNATTDILLESAFFKPRSVRRISKGLNLSTDSSYRFEREVDYNGVVRASDRAAALMAELAGGIVSSGVIDKKSSPRRPRKIQLRIPRMNQILNTRITGAAAKRVLKRLKIEAADKAKDRVEAVPPSYRIDLKDEIDLIEEVARLIGYDRIPAIPPKGIAPGPASHARYAARFEAASILASLGFSEAVCLSFIGEAEMDRLKWKQEGCLRNVVGLRNPVSAEFAFLRTSLLPPMMRCVELNIKRGNPGVLLFEIGTVFNRRDRDLPEEREKLALIASGNIGRGNWCHSPRQADFFFLKGVLEEMLNGTGRRISSQQAVMEGLHPGRAALLFLNGEGWGWMGEIAPDVSSSYDISSPVLYAEVDFEPLVNIMNRPRKHQPLPRFPSVERDIAILADSSIPASRIMECAGSAAPGLTQSVDIFDLYTGEQIPEGKKGLALSIKLRSPDRTLDEKDIDRAIGKIRQSLQGIGCSIREA